MADEVAVRGGLHVSRHFTRPGERAERYFTPETRDVSIPGAGFEQADVIVPSTWSQNALQVVASKYFRGALNSPDRERSVFDLIDRVVRTLGDQGLVGGYFASEKDLENFQEELRFLLLDQRASFNSPVWFNLGVETSEPQGSACFIEGVEDSIDGILELAVTAARIFKHGSGLGANLSSIRSHKELLSGGGRPSGLVSFMSIYDTVGSVVRSGGKTRRAAILFCCDDDHPDLLEFIECKRTEEAFARRLIQELGLNPNFWESGNAYERVRFQNMNLSVSVTDAFMKAALADRPWDLKARTTGQTLETVSASALLDAIVQAAWECADPGLQFRDTMNRWHTVPNFAPIRSTNPCSEYSHVDGSSCNLASHNLLKYRKEDGSFDIEGFVHAVRILTIAQDILVDAGSYPTERIARITRSLRPLGQNYTNLGAYLMSLGIPYDSVTACRLAADITALMTGAVYLTSAELAEALGPFAEYPANEQPMLGVLRRHIEALDWHTELQASEIGLAARRVWSQVMSRGPQFGFRNSQATCLAPTGTISFMMDCDTTGVEPDLSLVKTKNLVGGGTLRMVNQTVPLALRTLGYAEDQVERITEYVQTHGEIESCPDLLPDHRAVFDCALPCKPGGRCISPRGHLRMMAATQPFLSGAISKTVNLPRTATVADIREVYVEAWRLGLKAIAVYRDGCKESQPFASLPETKTPEPPAPARRRLPSTRNSITHKFEIGGHEGYFTVGLYEDGSPGEIFIQMAKEGSVISGLMDAWAIALSMGLQYGVPLGEICNKFAHMRFEPAGFTPEPSIRAAKSIVDYVARWLAQRFLQSEPIHGAVSADPEETTEIAEPTPQPKAGEAIAGDENPVCPGCGSLTRRTGTCFACPACGTSLGCS